MTDVDRRQRGKLAMNVETRMRLAFAMSNSHVFWPEQFLTSDAITIDDVLSAFKKLSDDGKIALILDVVCRDGHRVYTGSPEEAMLAQYCSECPDPIHGEVVAHLRAELTDDWVGELQTEAAEKKKKRNRWN